MVVVASRDPGRRGSKANRHSLTSHRRHRQPGWQAGPAKRPRSLLVPFKGTGAGPFRVTHLTRFTKSCLDHGMTSTATCESPMCQRSATTTFTHSDGAVEQLCRFDAEDRMRMAWAEDERQARKARRQRG